jgi:hypothetical protein
MKTKYPEAENDLEIITVRRYTQKPETTYWLLYLHYFQPIKTHA